MEEQNSFHSSASKAFLALIVMLFGVFGYNYLTSYPRIIVACLAGVLGAISYLAFSFGFKYLRKGFGKIPLSIFTSIFALLASGVMLKMVGFRFPDQVFYSGLTLCISFILLFFWCINRLKKGASKMHLLGVIVPILFVFVSSWWLFTEGKDTFRNDLAIVSSNKSITTLSKLGVDDPSKRGTFDVVQFTYGSGTDYRREEYSTGVKYKTTSVDAKLLIPAWKGKLKKWRERYWKFDSSELPINGRVYMPKSNKPSPLVLIVHGNHSMIDYSDGGYAYLGELLASRGFAVVSVDENFLNGHWSGDFRGKEMPARAWLLLKHLSQWNLWNSDTKHDLYNKIDMNNIMLVGHSRGGEAISIAAKFNKLTHFPDNALEKFDFNYNIKSVVSIAPTDYRYHRQVDLENLNYLSLQGSYDADEISFWGMRQYHRLNFTDENKWIKAGVYIHRANHGQFNSSWGRADMGAPFKWLLNTKPMVSAQDQQQAAALFISSFAEVTLADKEEYLPLFSNVAFAQDWLPINRYISSFQHSEDLIIQDYEEDLEISTGTELISIEGQNLAIWREENISTRDNQKLNNNAAVLGWNYGDSISIDSTAFYSLKINARSSMKLDSVSQLKLSLAYGNLEEFKKEDRKAKADNKNKSPKLDLTIQLVDSLGNKTQFVLSKIKNISPPLRSKFTKLKSLNKDMFGKDWEIQLESFMIPIENFKISDTDFDLNLLSEIRLVFDKTPFGVVVLDDVGFSYN